MDDLEKREELLTDALSKLAKYGIAYQNYAQASLAFATSPHHEVDRAQEGVDKAAKALDGAGQSLVTYIVQPMKSGLGFRIGKTSYKLGPASDGVFFSVGDYYHYYAPSPSKKHGHSTPKTTPVDWMQLFCVLPRIFRILPENDGSGF